MNIKHALIACCVAFLPQAALADIDGNKIFDEKCTTCHALDEAKMGPAVVDMNQDSTALRSAIADGVENGGPFPMPTFADVLKPDEIDALVRYIRSQQ